MLRLLGDRHGAFVAGGESFFPNSELFHVITVADTHIGSVFATYPRSSTETPRACVLDYTVTAIPWQRINVACFRIDSERSNAYSAAGGENRRKPFPSAAEAARIRHAQELAVAAPIRSGVALTAGEFRELVTIAPYAVVAYWITPYIADPPADPVWIEARLEDANVVLRWRPNVEPFFYCYEVYLIIPGLPEKLVSPMPLRSAMWVDTAPPPGTRSYAVRAVTASGIKSNLIASDLVTIR
jgi:hypothetical protein